MKPLKFGTSSMMWVMVGTNSTSMKDFISNEIIGEFSFLNDILYLPNNASISLWVWPSSMKFMVTSLNMPFATSKDQKKNRSWFLLYLEALSIWTFKMEVNDVDETGISANNDNDVSHSFAPSSTT
jgi:hypothetical protein